MRMLLLLLCCLALSAETLPSEALEQKLLRSVEQYEATMEGVLGFAALDLQSGRLVHYRGHTTFPQASSIKIPIMVEMFRAARDGRLRMEDRITLQPTEVVAGSGHLNAELKKGPLTLTLRELVAAMIQTSDNTATNRCIRILGMDAVNRTLGELGLVETRLQRIMLDIKAAEANRDNLSTPVDMVHLMQLIYRGTTVSPEASKEMIEIMKKVNDDLRKAIPASIAVASKPGEVTGVRCDTGIVFLEGRPFALSIMGTYLKEGQSPVGDITTLVLKHFQKLAGANAYGNAGTR
jgi:beta-lactamase class A